MFNVKNLYLNAYIKNNGSIILNCKKILLIVR